MDVWADSGEHHEARQKSSPLLARAKRARAIGVAGCFVESKYPHVIRDGPGHTWAQPDLLRRPTSPFRRKAKAVPVARSGRQVSYNESGCGDSQPSQIAIRSGGLSSHLMLLAEGLQLGRIRISAVPGELSQFLRSLSLSETQSG